MSLTKVLSKELEAAAQPEPRRVSWEGAPKCCCSCPHAFMTRHRPRASKCKHSHTTWSPEGCSTAGRRVATGERKASQVRCVTRMKRDPANLHFRFFLCSTAPQSARVSSESDALPPETVPAKPQAVEEDPDTTVDTSGAVQAAWDMSASLLIAGAPQAPTTPPRTLKASVHARRAAAHAQASQGDFTGCRVSNAASAPQGCQVAGDLSEGLGSLDEEVDSGDAAVAAAGSG